MKNLTHYGTYAVAICCFSFTVQAASAGESFSKGQSLELLWLDKLSTQDLSGLITDTENNPIAPSVLNQCTNVVTELLSDKITEGGKSYYYVKIRKPTLESYLGKHSFGKYDCFNEKLGANKLVSSDDEVVRLYKLYENGAAKVTHVRTGIDYGVLVVPFKIYTNGHTLKEGGTLGAYVGYKSFFPEHRWSFTPIVSFGYTKSQKFDALNPQTSRMQEYSADVISGAVGAIVGFSYDQFKLGVLIGRDRRNSSTLADKPSFSGNWVSLMFGIGIGS